MNSPRFQEKILTQINLLHFYTLLIKYQKEKVKKRLLESHKNIPRNKLNQGGERPYSLNIIKH